MEGLFRRSKLERRPVEMIYMSEKGIVTKRIVSIHQFNDETVIGYCHLRKAVRTFKRSNILSALPVKRSGQKDDQSG
ncbi:hypothetical protein [Alteribacter populi]|uniref:hypothetical protein n=1 Tax=Alteribacter populi TaxID=2011011 RepID=UPI000BBABD2C|nr:hypothetical protein [Alteribacter populi]